MSKHLNDLSAVYMTSIAEETVCPVCGFDPCQCLEGSLQEEDCGCDHAPKNKMQVGQEKAKEKYSGKKLRDLPGRKKVEEDKKPIHIGRMLSQASNKDYAASKEENPSKREKLETQARTIRTTVDMDSFKKRKSKVTPQRAGVQEGFSNWRTDLIEVIDNSYDVPSSQAQKDSEMKTEIKDKKVKNKVIINPAMGESVEALGGTILEFHQLDEISSHLALTASQKADEERRKAAVTGDKVRAAAKSAQASRLYKGVGPRKARERVKEDVGQVDEKLNLKKADMGDVVKDFYKSDAPQFKGKSKEKRRQMAVAAKLEAERGPQVKEARDPAKEEQGKKIASYEKTGRAFGLIKKFRQENPGSRQPKKVRGAKPTAGELNQQRIQAANKRIAKHGLTSTEKKETQARAKYDSSRD